MATTSNSLGTDLMAKLQSLQDAIVSGSQDKYDLALANLMGVFKGQPTMAGLGTEGLGVNGQPDAAMQIASGYFGPSLGNLAGEPTQSERQQNANITGTYTGYNTYRGAKSADQMAAEVQAADPGHYAAWAKAGMSPEQMWNQEFYGPGAQAMQIPTEAAREYDLNTQKSLLDTASKLTGPSDYAQFQQYVGGGRKLLDQLMGPTNPAFSGGAGSGLNPLTLQSLMAKLGAGGANTQAGYVPPSFTEQYGQPTGGGGGGMAGALLQGVKGRDGKYSTGGGGGSADPLSQIGGGLSDVGGDPFAPVNQSMYDFSQQMGGVPLKTVQRYAQANGGQAPTDWGSFQTWANQGGYDTSGAGQMTPAQEAAWVQAVDPGHYTSWNNAAWTPQEMWQAEGQQTPVAPQYATSQGNLSADQMVAKVQAADPGHYAAWQQAGYSPEQMWASEFYENPSTAAASPTKQLAGNQFQILPSQIDPAHWDALGTSGQQVVLSLAQAAGWDPNEFMKQLDSQRPLGQAFVPGSVATQFAPLAA